MPPCQLPHAPCTDGARIGMQRRAEWAGFLFSPSSLLPAAAPITLRSHGRRRAAAHGHGSRNQFHCAQLTHSPRDLMQRHGAVRDMGVAGRDVHVVKQVLRPREQVHECNAELGQL